MVPSGRNSKASRAPEGRSGGLVYIKCRISVHAHVNDMYTCTYDVVYMYKYIYITCCVDIHIHVANIYIDMLTVTFCSLHVIIVFENM